MVYRRTSDAAHAALGLTPERHAKPSADRKAARGLPFVFEIVPQESLYPPRVGFHRNASADATIDPKLRHRRARGAERRLVVQDREAETARQIHALPCGAVPHPVQNVHVGIERQRVTAATREIVQRKAWFE